jgi:type IV pilus assembly protein PilY1
MDLYNTENGNTDNNGERMVADPVLRDGKIIFVTLIPDPDPCRFGGDSWLMEVDAYSGARLPETPFDLDGDGFFTVGDYVTDSTGVDVVASGKKSNVGILPAPGILKDTTDTGTGSGREFKYFSGSSGDIEQVTESRGVGGIGRQSWRQIFNN